MISLKHLTAYKFSTPQYASCFVSKSQQHTIRKSVPSPLSNHLSINNTLPGEKIFVDQYVSNVKGRLSTSREKEHDKDKRVGGTIFVDATTALH